MNKLPAYKLYISNFLNIEDAELDLSPGVTGLVGKNDQGKTNFLEALNSILDGSHDLKKIKDGETRSEIRIEEVLDGETIASVARIQTQKQSRIDAKGDLHNLTPARYLETIIDKIVVNPIKLITEDPVKYLKAHLPIKATQDDLPKNMLTKDCPFDLEKNAFKECEKQTEFYEVVRRATYQEKRHAFEVVEELKQNLPEMPSGPAFTRESLLDEAGDIKGKISNIEANNNEVTELMKKVETLKGILDTANYSIKHKNSEIETLRADYSSLDDELETKMNELKSRYDAKKKEVVHQADMRTASINNIAVNVKVVTEQLNEIADKLDGKKILSKLELDNELAKNKEKYQQLSTFEDMQRRYEQLRDKEDRFTELKKRYDSEDGLFKYFEFLLPNKLINRSNLPVRGIEFKNQELYVEGRHINRLATSKRAIAAVRLSIALAEIKGQKVIGFDGAEVLDEENRAEFIKAIQDSKVRVVYTRWGDPEYKHEMLVENGRLKK